MCKYQLSPKDLFCPGCGPPSLPDEDPDEGLSIGQTALRIALILLLFMIIVVYKFDMDLRSYLPGFQSTENLPVGKPAEDAKVVYLVAVPQANVRASGSPDAKIIFILEKGATVVVLQQGLRWWQVQFGGRIGWISSDLLMPKVE